MVRYDRALRDHWYAIHIWSPIAVLSMPMDQSGHGIHPVPHVDNYYVTNTNLQFIFSAMEMANATCLSDSKAKYTKCSIKKGRMRHD